MLLIIIIIWHIAHSILNGKFQDKKMFINDIKLIDNYFTFTKLV